MSFFYLAGILVVGGWPGWVAGPGASSLSVEFWSEADRKQESCFLEDYPRAMFGGPTVNLVSGRLVACFEHTCEIYEGSWKHLQNTRVTRKDHSSATTKDAVLLIGGAHSNTSEWIPVDGSPAQPGPFRVRHGHRHCTIQISADVIVVTGGRDTYDYVTQYRLSDGYETPLASLGEPRHMHACGVYQDTNGQQVSQNVALQ